MFKALLNGLALSSFEKGSCWSLQLRKVHLLVWSTVNVFQSLEQPTSGDIKKQWKDLRWHEKAIVVDATVSHEIPALKMLQFRHDVITTMTTQSTTKTIGRLTRNKYSRDLILLGNFYWILVDACSVSFSHCGGNSGEDATDKVPLNCVFPWW